MAKNGKSAGKKAELKESASETSKKKHHKFDKAHPTSKDNDSAPAMMGGKHVKMPYGSHSVDKADFAPMSDKKPKKKKAK